MQLKWWKHDNSSSLAINRQFDQCVESFSLEHTSFPFFSSFRCFRFCCYYLNFWFNAIQCIHGFTDRQIQGRLIFPFLTKKSRTFPYEITNSFIPCRFITNMCSMRRPRLHRQSKNLTWRHDIRMKEWRRVSIKSWNLKGKLHFRLDINWFGSHTYFECYALVRDHLKCEN